MQRIIIWVVCIIYVIMINSFKFMYLIMRSENFTLQKFSITLSILIILNRFEFVLSHLDGSNIVDK